MSEEIQLIGLVSIGIGLVSLAVGIFRVAWMAGSINSKAESFFEFVTQGISEIRKETSEINKGIFEINKGISEIRKEISEINKGISEINKGISEIKNAIRDSNEELYKRLDKRFSEAILSGSPLRLSELGKKISRKLEAPREVERLVPDISARIESKNPYDIQEFCSSFIHAEYRPSTEFEELIKQCAYETGLDRYDVLSVLAIELRDKILESGEPPSVTGDKVAQI